MKESGCEFSRTEHSRWATLLSYSTADAQLPRRLELRPAGRHVHQFQLNSRFIVENFSVEGMEDASAEEFMMQSKVVTTTAADGEVVHSFYTS